MLDLSLGIPLYRSAPYLPELFSALQQLDPAPAEIIFLDDASPDDGVDQVEAFCRRYRGSARLRLERNPTNLGIAGTYNRLASLATTRWLQILDGDDRPLAADYYACLAPHLMDGEVGLVVSGVDSNALPIHWGNRCLAPLVPVKPPRWLPMLGTFATRSGVIYLRELLLKANFEDPAFPGSDVLHFLRLRKHVGCVYVRRARVFYRVHEAATSSVQRDYARYREALRKEGPWTRLVHCADLALREFGQLSARRKSP